MNQQDKKNKQLRRFEKENAACYELHKKAFQQIKINQDAFSGYIPKEGEEGSVDRQRVKTNIIKSYLISLLPHIFAKKPTATLVKQEKVNPIDGDVDEAVIYENIDKFAETGRIVLDKSMDLAGIKKHFKKAVKRKKIDCASIIKVSYRKDFYDDPMVMQEIQTEQQQMARLASMSEGLKADTKEYEALVESINNGSYDPTDSELADKYSTYKDTLKSLQEGVRQVSGEGVNLQVVPINQCRWDKTKPIDEFCDGKFIAHYLDLSVDEAKAKHKIAENKDDPECRIKKWSRFGGMGEENQGDKDAYKSDSDKQYVREWERWDSITNTRYNWIEGDCDYVSDPKPEKSLDDQFYPFFVLCEESDGTTKLPPSGVELMIPIQEQYEKDTLDKRDHRLAAIPKIFVDGQKVSGKELKPKIEKAGVLDMIIIDTNGAPISQIITPMPLAPLDPRLYDRQDLLFDMQTTTGLQDAERGAINKAKTLGEAEIQQAALAGRTETERDDHEEVLREIYRYSFMLIMQEMSEQEVKRIAGDYAFWPTLEESQESYFSLIDVSIDVGSSSKPNKAQEQRVWFDNIEFLMGAIERITEMRKQGVEDQDNPYYRILEETLRRLDERLDIATLIPKTKVITSAELIQSVTQQVQQLAQTNPDMASLAQQFLQSNPVVQQVTQEIGQNNETLQ